MQLTDSKINVVAIQYGTQISPNVQLDFSNIPIGIGSIFDALPTKS
jgi:hypothetical protein